VHGRRIGRGYGLGIIEIVARAFDQLLHAALRIFLTTMTFIENALRGPLDAVHIHGSLQTLILMLIPALTIVAVVKLFGGILRFIVVVVLVLVLAHILYPLIMGSGVQTP
jgi:hypothetical protein